MDIEQDRLVFVPELAKILNTTDAAIRTRVARDMSIPPRYSESRKLCWRMKDVEKFLLDQISTEEKV